jgi:hypothetical protein
MHAKKSKSEPRNNDFTLALPLLLLVIDATVCSPFRQVRCPPDHHPGPHVYGPYR